MFTTVTCAGNGPKQTISDSPVRSWFGTPGHRYITGDPNWPGCTTPAAVAGYPHVTVPAGFAHGLPVGLSFFGPAWSEPVLLKLAYAFEQAAKARRPPGFAPTIDSARL